MQILFYSMGCPKNTADSEHLARLLRLNGHTITKSLRNARAAIINTCGFIQDAVKENINAILDLEELKTQKKIKKLIVFGCLVNRYEEELRKEFPSVDLFARSEDFESVIKFLDGEFDPDFFPFTTPLDNKFWTRYLKISEGCNSHCSYCTIPSIRGPLRSVPMEKLIKEAEALNFNGGWELCLVGQDLTVYGQDFKLKSNTGLKNLLSSLDSALERNAHRTWIRLMYLHPNRVDEPLIDFLLEQKKVLRYLDIPIQHSDPEILKLMNRPCPKGHLKKIFKYIREADPEFALRTTIMTGFPGETEEKFESLLEFISEVEFDRLGVFVFSPEEGTPAAKLPGQVPHEVAVERCNRILELQSRITEERGELFIGHELKVLVEELDEENNVVIGRSFRDAPDIDGVVIVEPDPERKLRKKIVKPGDFIRVEITRSEGPNLYGNRIY